jgi:hypothetical protein
VFFDGNLLVKSSQLRGALWSEDASYLVVKNMPRFQDLFLAGPIQFQKFGMSQ